MKFKINLILVIFGFAVTSYCGGFQSDWEGVDWKASLRDSIQELPQLEAAALIERLIQAIDAGDADLVGIILPILTKKAALEGGQDLQSLFRDLQHRTHNNFIQNALNLESDINNTTWMFAAASPGLPDIPVAPVSNANDFSWMFDEVQGPARSVQLSLADVIKELSKLEFGQSDLAELDKAIQWYIRGGGQLPEIVIRRIGKARSRILDRIPAAAADFSGDQAGPA